MAELSEYVTASMLAKQTGLGYTTIIARIHDANVPIQRLGKIILIERKDVASVTRPLYQRGIKK